MKRRGKFSIVSGNTIRRNAKKGGATIKTWANLNKRKRRKFIRRYKDTLYKYSINLCHHPKHH